MRYKYVSTKSSLVVLAILMLASVSVVRGTQGNQAELKSPATRDIRRLEMLKEEIRHRLVTLPYYTVFDWLEAEAKDDGTVILTGQVVRQTLKSDAEAHVKKIESATRVINNIELLPLSSLDIDLRMALYRRIFSFDSPLFRYGTMAVPPIHIIVSNGRVVLKGIVANHSDSQLAYLAARQVPNVFDVKNELQIEERTTD